MEKKFIDFIEEIYREFGVEGLIELQGSLLDENCFTKAELVEQKLNEVK